MTIRLATTQDSREILNVYSKYIETPITFEYVLPSEEEFTERISQIVKDYPYLVCEENNKIIGYAYAHRHKERQAYQWNAELSIYIDKKATSKGIGKKLYSCLIEILKMQNIKTVYGCVTIPNEKSEKLHRSLGFKYIGTYHNTGYKCNQWRDVGWFEKQITPYDLDPSPIISITKLNKKDIDSIINKYNY